MNVATCQFNVGPSVRRNGSTIRRQIAQSTDSGADVVHFPEYGLCGYAGWDFSCWDEFDWDLLDSETHSISAQAKTCGVWVLLGSAHRLSDGHLPHNCLYIIAPDGHIVDRYDKRFCSLPELDHYTSGDHFTVFDIDGVRCSVLICNDSNFPELYRELGKLDIRCVFHSFHIARCPSPNRLTQIVPRRMQSHASVNRMWISVNNSTRRIQANPSLLIRPNGSLAGSLPRHRANLMVRRVDVQGPPTLDEQQKRAINGIFHSGTLVKDPRSRNRTSL